MIVQIIFLYSIFYLCPDNGLAIYSEHFTYGSRQDFNPKKSGVHGRRGHGSIVKHEQHLSGTEHAIVNVVLGHQPVRVGVPETPRAYLRGLRAELAGERLDDALVPVVFADRRPTQPVHGVPDRVRDGRALDLRVQSVPAASVQVFAVDVPDDPPHRPFGNRLAESRPQPKPHQRLQRLVRRPIDVGGQSALFRPRFSRRHGHFRGSSTATPC